MLLGTISPNQKRKHLYDQLKTQKLLKFPGAFSPLIAMQIEKLGFDGVYVSGSVLSNDLGYPDIGLTTLTEVSQRGRQIARATSLPTIIDMDTGFGEPLNVIRSVQEFIELGLSGAHIEDQVNPKRCGHLENKSLVSTESMQLKIKAAREGKKADPHFLIIARTDARASEGLQSAIKRAQLYVEAGADAIFPEALVDEKEFETFRKHLNVPLLANMTEFGKSPLLSASTLENIGFNMVIYPVTTLRLAMKASEAGLLEIKKYGSQEAFIEKMQTRNELYELTRYSEYSQWDQNIYKGVQS